MSIMICDQCERPVDTDFHPMNEVDGKHLCEGCDPGEERKEDGGPAFAAAAGTATDMDIQYGMSLRDWFAGQAIVGILSANAFVPGAPKEQLAEVLAITAYRVADEVLKARGEAK